MTSTIIFTDTITSGTAFIFAADNDTLWLAANTLLGSRDSDAIRGAFDNLTLRIDGNVWSGPARAIDLDENARVSIGRTGSVSSGIGQSDATIWLEDNASLVNDGEITGVSSIGVLTSGDSDILNRGDIYGRSNGVFLGLFGGENDKLVNHGNISAGDGGEMASLRLYNGVFAEGDNTTIINTGTISTTSSTGAGVRIGGAFDGAFGGDGTLVKNHGEIIASNGIGVDFSNLPDGDSATLMNYGLISGATFGFLGGDGTNLVTNGGEIYGDVGLGKGDDVYEARTDGRVDGTVNGGAGDDTLTGGAEIDNLNGNSGNDLIVGRAGDDIIRGDNGNDHLRGQAGDDILIGGNGEDVLNGGRGDDILTGNGSGDTFVFGLDAGNDTITFFKDGADLIDLTAYDLLSNEFSAIRNAISDAEDGATFLDLSEIGGTGSVFIEGLGISEVDATDFLF